MTRAGFIGLGSQGAGMAQRIIEQGVPTTLWARRAVALEPFAGAAAIAADPVELGRVSDVVGICVTDGAAVRAVTLGSRGVLAGMTEGSVLALHSTIGADECAEIAAAAQDRGVAVIDAPVSGGGAAAAEGRLTVYVGGTDAAVARARSVLETYGDPVLHMGALGAGLRTKLLNNALNAAHFALAHYAFALGATLGLDPAALSVALRSGSGRSFSLEVFAVLRSFDAIADHVGPIMAKDIALFDQETAAAPDREVLLGSADRFLELLGHPRGVAGGNPVSASASGSRPSVDTRTRSVGASEPVAAAAFWDGEWKSALARNGDRVAADAERLGLPPLAIGVDNDVWTLRRGNGTLEVVPGRGATTLAVTLDGDAFADLVTERRTALGLVIGARVEGSPESNEIFCAWDPVLRSALDGRGVYRPGTVTLRAFDDSPLDLDQRFRLGDRPDEAADFLAVAGFLLLQGVFTDEEIDAVDADLARAVEEARPDDGASWWAKTRAGEQYPCRILDFARKSEALRDLFDEPRFLAIGELLGDGHRPGDPFGEHFSEVTAEGLVKRVESVEGLACLPWHKDCERGGHSMFCSGLTIGICLTPVDDAHGGLDVVAGSHRANIARVQVDRDLDLPRVTLRADRGDLTVHMSCALHRSTHPTSRERRVAYTGFALPPRPGDEHAEGGQARLRRERAVIGGPADRPRLASEIEPGTTRR